MTRPVSRRQARHAPRPDSSDIEASDPVSHEKGSSLAGDAQPLAANDDARSYVAGNDAHPAGCTIQVRA
jgi:hypothetical protein